MTPPATYQAWDDGKAQVGKGSEVRLGTLTPGVLSHHKQHYQWGGFSNRNLFLIVLEEGEDRLFSLRPLSWAR